MHCFDTVCLCHLACAGVGGGAGGIPFEVWCRYYYPNVRDQVIAKVYACLHTRDLRIGNFRSNRISNRISNRRLRFELNLKSNQWVIVYMFNADCRRSFSVSGPDAWNSLPCQLRGIAVASTFKRRLKSELFFQAYSVSTTASTVAEP